MRKFLCFKIFPCFKIFISPDVLRYPNIAKDILNHDIILATHVSENFLSGSRVSSKLTILYTHYIPYT